MSHRPKGPRVGVLATAGTTLDPEVALGSSDVTLLPDGSLRIRSQAFTVLFDRQNHWVSARYDYGSYRQEVLLTAGDETDAQGRAYWERLAAAIPREPVARPALRGAPEAAPPVGDAHPAARPRVAAGASA